MAAINKSIDRERDVADLSDWQMFWLLALSIMLSLTFGFRLGIMMKTFRTAPGGS